MDESFHVAIRRWVSREFRGNLSQAAKQSGVSRSTIQHWVNGKAPQAPTRDNLEKLWARGFDWRRPAPAEGFEASYGERLRSIIAGEKLPPAIAEAFARRSGEALTIHEAMWHRQAKNLKTALDTPEGRAAMRLAKTDIVRLHELADDIAGKTLAEASTSNVPVLFG